MKKFLFSLGLLAALAAPAAAGRLDNSEFSGSQQDATAPAYPTNGVQPSTDDYPADIDRSTTGSIQAPAPQLDNGGSDLQRGDQGAYFGANGH